MRIQANSFVLQDVRCFRGMQKGQIRPITLLIGENSTGKTTFLASYSVLYRILRQIPKGLEQSPDFDVDPFSMGSFQNIARYNGRMDKSVKEFKLGIEIGKSEIVKLPYQLIATFSEQMSMPTISSFQVRVDDGTFFEFVVTERGTRIKYPSGEIESEMPLEIAGFVLDLLQRRIFEEVPMLNNIYPFINYFQHELAARIFHSVPDQKYFSRIVEPLSKRALIPIAPLRGKPERTYDPLRETVSPEGSHVPMLLMRLAHSDETDWKSLRESLVGFGKESGLLTDIKVKRYGSTLGEPFQIQVKAQSKSYSNIMDVGYGVSQCLPILVDVLTRARNEEQRVFLMQQPEVHLHPRGQAELASFLVSAASRGNNQFMIETHSDYIVDRVRILVRKGRINAEDVSFLYFEPKDDSVTLHNISVDESGNLENPPVGYRSFFEREIDDLLGF